MLSFVVVITLFALLATVNWSPLAWRVISRWQRRRGALEDQHGFARIRLPAGWGATSGLNREATIQARHVFRNRYLIVISESREDFPPTVDLSEHAARTLLLLGASYQLLKHDEMRGLELAGLPACQIELEMVADGTLITYLHTTVAGERAFHQILAWATRSQYCRRDFEAILESFAELPGPLPRPLDTEILTPDRLLVEAPRRRIGF